MVRYFVLLSGTDHPYQHLVRQLQVGSEQFSYYDLPAMQDTRFGKGAQ